MPGNAVRTLKGIIVVVPTPFDTERRIDDASVERMVDHYLALDVQALTIMGVMGEGAKLSAREASALMKRIFSRVDGRIPVIVGASNPNDDTTVAIAEEAIALGAAGAMIAPKRGLVGDDAVSSYFEGLCERLGPAVPVCLQDYPPASGVSISVEGLAGMCRALPQLEMIKLEDMPNLPKLTGLLQRLSEIVDPRPAIFVGNNALFVDLELGRGADGIMSGFAFPEALQRVYRCHIEGDPERAAEIYQAYLPLIRYESQPGVGLAARKYVLHRKGIIACPTLRDPGYDLTPEDRAEIDVMLSRLDRVQDTRVQR